MCTAHEVGVCQLQNGIVRDNLKGEYMPMQTTNETTREIEIKATQLVFVNDLTALVQELLDEYQKEV